LEFLKSTLSVPNVYDFYQSLVGEPKAHRRFIDEFVKPRASDRVVDFGCGLGVILDHLPPGTPYVGLDFSDAYLTEARRRYGSRGTFLKADLHDVDMSAAFEPFDIGLAYGVMHHLNDEDVLAMACEAKRLIRLGGRFVTLDPVYVVGQSRMAKFLIDHDRGEFARREEGYRKLLEQIGRVETAVVSGFLRVPYTEVICTVWF
jgi:SAM-dependent methyltransferase